MLDGGEGCLQGNLTFRRQMAMREVLKVRKGSGSPNRCQGETQSPAEDEGPGGKEPEKKPPESQSP